MKNSIVVKLIIAISCVFLIGAGSSYAIDTQDKFSDPRERSLEAGSVVLVQNSAGTVVEVRVADCELCDRKSYLPRRNLEVMVAGESISKEDLSAHSGRPGSIVFNEKDYMVFGVYYWSGTAWEEKQ